MLNFPILKNKYLECYPYLFLVYLFCLFSFGRAFAIINIPAQPVPIFVTEIFLFLSLPYFFLNIKKVFEVPRLFLVTFLLFCGLGSIYLASGLIQGNLFALRDIVLCVYPVLFVFLSFFIFQAHSNRKNYLILILIADLFLLVFGRLFLKLHGLLGSGTLLPNFLQCFLSSLQGFQFGFYHGIIICALISIIILKQKKPLQLSSVFLLGLNLYMVITSTCRSAWVALVAVLMFFLVSNWKKMRRTYVFWILTIILVYLLSMLDFDLRQGKGGITINAQLLSFKKIVDWSIDGRHDPKEKINAERINKDILVGQGDIIDTEHVKKGIVYNQGDIRLKNQTIDSVYNANWRLLIWRQSINFVKNSMFLGRGFGIYPDYYWPGGSRLMQIKGFSIDSGIIPAHNELVTLLYKMGLLGLFLFIFFNGYVFLMGIRFVGMVESDSFSILAWMTLGSFVWWHIMALTSPMIDSPMMNIFLWVFLGILLNIIKVKKRKGNSID